MASPAIAAVSTGAFRVGLGGISRVASTFQRRFFTPIRQLRQQVIARGGRVGRFAARAAPTVAAVAATEIAAQAIERGTGRNVPFAGQSAAEVQARRAAGLRPRAKQGLINKRSMRTIRKAFTFAKQLDRAQKKLMMIARKAGVRPRTRRVSGGSPGIISRAEALAALRG